MSWTPAPWVDLPDLTPGTPDYDLALLAPQMAQAMCAFRARLDRGESLEAALDRSVFWVLTDQLLRLRENPR